MCSKNITTCVFLDANALYHYLGRDKLFTEPSKNVDKKILTEKLEQYTNIYLPSSVFTEIIVHFRNELNKLQDIFYFIATKKIKIVPVGVKEYTSEELNKFAAMTESDKHNYLKKQLDEKIVIESGFAVLFLFSISIAYSGYLARQNGIDDNAFMNAFGRYIQSNLLQSQLHELNNSLVSGYAINKELKFLKKKYTELLQNNVVLAHGAILNISTNGTPTEQEVTNSISRLSAMGFTNADFNIMDKIKEINNDPVFLTYVLTSIPNTFKVKKYTQVQINYLRIKYEAWLLRGQILRKNDVYDILFLDSFSDHNLSNLKSNLNLPSLTVNDILLVSFDDDVKEYIKVISPTSYSFITSIPPSTL